MRSANFGGSSTLTSLPASSSTLICDGISCQYRILYVLVLPSTVGAARRRRWRSRGGRRGGRVRLRAGESQEQIDGRRRVLAVAVGADFVGEHLADRRAADRHLDVPAAGGFEAVDDGLHVGHRRREQRAHADDRRVASCPPRP